MVIATTLGILRVETNEKFSDNAQQRNDSFLGSEFNTKLDVKYKIAWKIGWCFLSLDTVINQTDSKNNNYRIAGNFHGVQFSRKVCFQSFCS